jgi:ABC-type multidrug transport system fused ATPase/permease subunit
MIAHRLGTLEHCDVRLEIEEGRVVELEPPVTAAKVAGSLHRSEEIA